MNCACCGHPLRENHQPTYRRDQAGNWQVTGDIVTVDCWNKACVAWGFSASVEHYRDRLAYYLAHRPASR